MKIKKFYNFARDSDGNRELFIDGNIAEDVWFGDEVTPQAFKAELFSATGDITIWINSNGGDVFAASQIYTMLMDYSGAVTAKIYGMCASAATVIACAAGKVLMSPPALMFVHNPMTLAFGNKAALQKSIEFLDEVKEGILNAYEIKTGLSRVKLSHLMDDETPMNVHKAIALGFCDGVLEDTKQSKIPPSPKSADNTISLKSLDFYNQRLSLIMGGISYGK